MIVQSNWECLSDQQRKQYLDGWELFKTRAYKSENGKLPDQRRVPNHLSYFSRFGYITAFNMYYDKSEAL